jgi:hypothetical protein
MKRVFLAAIIVVCFTQCNQDKGWSTADKEKATKTCTDGMEGTVDKAVGKKYCDCVMEQAMKKYKNLAEMDQKGTEAMAGQWEWHALLKLPALNNSSKFFFTRCRISQPYRMAGFARENCRS